MFEALYRDWNLEERGGEKFASVFFEQINDSEILFIKLLLITNNV